MQLAFPNNPDLPDVYGNSTNYFSDDHPESILRRYRTNFNRRKNLKEFVQGPSSVSNIASMNLQIANINNRINQIQAWIPGVAGNTRTVLINQVTRLANRRDRITTRRDQFINQAAQRQQAYTNKNNLLMEAGRVLRTIYIAKTGKAPVLFVS